MFKRFQWTKRSEGRNVLTAQYEPVQPYLFVEFSRSVAAEFAVDVGANIGQYSLFSREARCVARVYAFEAEQMAYDQLVENIELNKLEDFIKPYFGIVSSSSGELNFGVASPMGGNNAVTDTSIHGAAVYKENRRIQAVTLDEKLDLKDKRVVLKMDVEGHEAEVLKGARNLLSRNICVLQVEVYNKQNHVPEILIALGYKQLLAVGPDVYFSNYGPLFNEGMIIQVMETALANLIAYNLGG